MKKLLKSIFGDPNERDLKRYREVVKVINALEADVKALTNDQLRAKTEEFRQRLADGEELDDLMPEAFAVVREASVRAIGLRPYDVQLIGGMVLHDGKIAEMKTGEGKTLVATLPLYLNALGGKGAHLVTPNDYLSKFGLQTMGAIYHLLGLRAAVIQNAAADPTRGSFLYDPTFSSDDDRYQNLRPISRREAYAADITYGTNNEFGFDYLRDNMVRTPEEMVQRGHAYAIVDEVDNILIDEARTPLIISGVAEQPREYYQLFAKLVRDLKPSSEESIAEKAPDGDYVEDPKTRTVFLTEQGTEKIEQRLRRANLLQGNELYAPENSEMIPYLDNSLRAQVIYERDKDYMVEGGQVIIVDEFTGRAMYGRRFSEGLHQAIEAKEGVTVQRENMTLATVTFQNYFRLYEKLGGMTGTALTEADEFWQIYKLEVVAIPTHLPNIRVDQEDLVFMNERAKWDAILRDIKERHARKQPILIGTVAIETSERLSKLLDRAGIPHNVLNAKQHEREAIIISQAGRPSAVTIATNMAGRGVDILLGGNPEGVAREKLRKQGVDITEATPQQWQTALEQAKAECKHDREIVVQAGGLYVIGTERHEARRIDNQLRGRSGRQGDPGESQFYLSLEDDLMRRFGGERVKNLMKTLRMPEDEPIKNPIISSSIQQAQIRIEGYNFDIRKRVLEYDDVVNKQREVIYKQRQQVLETPNLREQIEKWIADEMTALVDEHYTEVPPDSDDEGAWNPDDLYRAALAIFPVPAWIQPANWIDKEEDEIVLELTKGALEVYNGIEAAVTAARNADAMRQLERDVILFTMDQLWVRHLTDLDMLREGIWSVAIGNRDPLVEYKRESFQMWTALQAEIRRGIVRTVLRIEVQPQTAALPTGKATNGTPNTIGAKNVRASHASISAYDAPKPAARPQPVRESAPEPDRADVWSKTGRNDPCPCGSGKKYKNCHYPIIQQQRAVVDQSEVKKTLKRRR
ncbi:MAG: preprotein translocase subunit SecA [Chloroflexi bacterium CFX4]|nr:preprotein translocase subunit SecA [Chloroflexi bacterium CFX4]MDL1923377.1 preprotein translocase subunit SecA [Chloroflexi bacterium CFX3]